MCFCAVLINTFISPPREYKQLVKIKSPVIFLMQIKLFVKMETLLVNFLFAQQNMILMITSHLTTTFKWKKIKVPLKLR